MKKYLILLGATLVGGALFAQPRVIGVHPAHDGKLLTMEDAVASRNVSPENRFYSWVNDNEFRFMDDRTWVTASIGKKGEITRAEPEPDAMPGQGLPPRGMPGAGFPGAGPQNGWRAVNVGNSLYITDGKDTVAGFAGALDSHALDDTSDIAAFLSQVDLEDGKKIVGEARIQVTRTVPGRILSQGVSNSFDGYLAGSLQRKAVMFTDARTSDEAEVLYARGVMVECLPDAPGTEALSADFGDISVSPRRILARAGLSGAELRRTDPISFACRCSPERAAATIAALGESDRAGLPPVLDVTCHMCGRTYSISTAT